MPKQLDICETLTLERQKQIRNESSHRPDKFSDDKDMFSSKRPLGISNTNPLSKKEECDIIGGAKDD